MNKIFFSIGVLILLGILIFINFSYPENKVMKEYSKNNNEILNINNPSSLDNKQEELTIINKVETLEENIELKKEEEISTENLIQNNDINTMQDFRIKITTGDVILYATLYNNATSRDFVSRLPLSLKMDDLYAREMCYNFPESLETDNVEHTGYEVGEIIYWPPANSFVIMYKQNGERFSMQKVGMIDSGVEFFNKSGDVEVKFELEK